MKSMIYLISVILFLIFCSGIYMVRKLSVPGKAGFGIGMWPHQNGLK